jgi:hypothetical protein
MTRAVYIVGNDGSGKTTYALRLEERLCRRGYSVTRQHYYRQWVRRAFRSAVERSAGVSKLKAGDAGERGASSGPQGHAPGGPRRTDQSTTRKAAGRVLVAFLYVYQLAMAMEMHLKLLVSRVDFRIIDRSYIDDLASILGSFRFPTPARLIRFSSRVFPQWRIIYVSAGHDVEYARIKDVDLAKSLHREKSLRYEEMLEILASAGAPLRRVDTGPRPRAQKLEQSGDEQ